MARPKMGTIKKAVAALTKAIENHDGTEKAWVAYGIAWQKLGNAVAEQQPPQQHLETMQTVMADNARPYLAP